jgi:hypothetical protein
MRRFALLFVVAIIAVIGTVAASGQLDEVSYPFPEDPAIEYAKRPVDDVVSRLNRGLEAGKARLNFDGPQGYLRSVLDALNVPVESQMAVFSRTSVQAGRISPQNPRTLFFNDSVTVGWVNGGFIELAAEDPKQGVIFYTLAQAPWEQPQFKRDNSCLTCHESYDALGVPGMIVRSNYTAPTGVIARELGFFNTDHRSPFEERWGGWYVTGNSGAIGHMGNAMLTDRNKPESMVTAETRNLPSLKGKFDTDAYLTPYSDIVALMVFEHQMRMVNLLTRMGWQTRRFLSQTSDNSNPADRRTLQAGLDVVAKELVDYMLFVDEAPFPNAIKGTSGFTEKFSVEGPRDSQGRSLRQLDLEHRLLKYPCSYMIYSEAFDALPPEAKDLVYRRMWQVLSGQIRDSKYARLNLADRQAIVGILRETKADLPSYFQPTP